MTLPFAVPVTAVSENVCVDWSIDAEMVLLSIVCEAALLPLIEIVPRPGATIVLPSASVVETVKLTALVPAPATVPPAVTANDPAQKPDAAFTTNALTFASSVAENVLGAPCTTVKVGSCCERMFPVAPFASHDWIVTLSIPIGIWKAAMHS